MSKKEYYKQFNMLAIYYKLINKNIPLYDMCIEIDAYGDYSISSSMAFSISGDIPFQLTNAIVNGLTIEKVKNDYKDIPIEWVLEMYK